jgi:hypothetical protein
MDNKTTFLNGMVIEGTLPATTTGQLSLGVATSGTASAGGGQAIPGTVLGYLLVGIQGLIVKFPYFSL